MNILYNTLTDTQVIIHRDKLMLGYLTHKPNLHHWIEYYPDCQSFDNQIDVLLNNGYVIIA